MGRSKHEMKRILPPHREQDGWRHVRVSIGRDNGVQPLQIEDGETYYDDAVNGSRIISSRRVEEAVETADYLKRCEEEGLVAQRGAPGLAGRYQPAWVVRFPLSVKYGGLWFEGKTLREAYYRMTTSPAYWRYKNAGKQA